MRGNLSWHRVCGATVDTHILVHHGAKHPDWLDQCLASLESEPTNVLLVRSTETNIGALRALAFQLGTAPYVCFVDDDDYVRPGAFTAALGAIDGHVGAYTDIAALSPAGELREYQQSPWNWERQCQRPIHEVCHLHVLQRSVVEPLLPNLASWPSLEEAWLLAKMAQAGSFIHVPFPGYVKRTATQGGAGRRITYSLKMRLEQELEHSSAVLIPG